jgi:ABC-type Na+ efflux pump permease subunit
MTGRTTPVRLVAGLTLRDLRRNVGAWRLPALSSLLFAVLFVGSAAVTSALQERADDLEFAVAVDGAVDGAPLVLEQLDATRLRITEEPDAGAAVREVDATVGLTLPPDLDERLLAGEAVTLGLSQRASQNISQEGTGWVLVTLSQVAGRDPVATITEVDVNDDGAVARRSFGRTVAALTAFLTLGVVTSVAAIIGGTRDRRGVEPLLVTPVSRTAISGGTALGAMPMAVLYVGVGLGVLLLTAALPLPSLGQPASVLLDGAPVTALVVVAMAALGAGFGVVAGALGGGSSDAMGTGDLLAMPLAALGVLLLLVPDLATTPGLAAVPGLGVLLVLRDCLSGSVSPSELVIALASTLLAALALVWLGGRLLGRERNVRRV